MYMSIRGRKGRPKRKNVILGLEGKVALGETLPDIE